MADYFGVRPVSSTLRFSFTTHAATGAPVAPSSSFEAADLKIYKDGNATERSSANGITMTSPFDSITGLHHVDIDLSDNSDAGFYAAGSQYEVVLSPNDETVDSVTVLKVLGRFEIGVPPANVTQFGGNNGTFASGIPEVKVASLAAAAIQSVWDALTSALTTSGSIGKRLADDIDATISSRLASGSYTAPPSAATIAAAVWDYLSATATTVGSLGKRIVDFLTGDAFARLGAPAGASVSADVAAVKADTAAIKLKTDTLPASPAAVGSAMTLTSGERTAIANEVEAQIIDETDSEKVLTAITDKIASVNPDLSGLTLSAIASAVRTELTTELARIDATISSRSTYAGGDTAGTTTLLARLTAIRAGLLDNLTNLDALVSSRSTYNGGDTSGVTTLLARLTALRAAALDNLDAAVSEVLAVLGTPSTTTGTIAGDIAALEDNVGGLDPNDFADALLDRADGIEAGLTPRQAQRLIAAAAAGVISGAETGVPGTVLIRNAVANSKTRITATVDENGNRTAIVADVA